MSRLKGEFALTSNTPDSIIKKLTMYDDMDGEHTVAPTPVTIRSFPPEGGVLGLGTDVEAILSGMC
jgi:hypothetical protein